MKVLHTSRARGGDDTGWMSDDPWEWTRGTSRAPGWGARNVKFGCGGVGGRAGHEIMTFTEVRTNSIVFEPNFDFTVGCSS
jgi:hypothetical protein